MRSILPTLCLLLSAAAAQTPPCFSLNDANTSVTGNITSYGFAGQNVQAWQITPTTNFIAWSAQVFTRNALLTGDRFMILELWSDVGGLPGVRLGGGTWRIVNARPYAWQGADLDQPVVVVANTPLWLTWIDPGSSTPPVETGGAVMPRATRSSAGVWTAGAASAPKVRLFCGPLDDAYSQPFGSGCALSTGQFSSVFTNEQPTLGNAGFFFETSGNPSGGAVFVVIGFDPNWIAIPVPGFPVGCLQNTDVVATLFALAGTGTTRGPTCAGYVSAPLAIPFDPGLTGQLLAAQAVPFDAGAVAPLPFATSNAQRIILY